MKAVSESSTRALTGRTRSTSSAACCRATPRSPRSTGTVGRAPAAAAAPSRHLGPRTGLRGDRTVTSATPPGSVPTFTLGGCATSQSEVALTLQRLRLIDGVGDVSLKSSTKAGSSANSSSSAQRAAAKGPRRSACRSPSTRSQLRPHLREQREHASSRHRQEADNDHARSSRPRSVVAALVSARRRLDAARLARAQDRRQTLERSQHGERAARDARRRSPRTRLWRSSATRPRTRRS